MYLGMCGPPFTAISAQRTRFVERRVEKPGDRSRPWNELRMVSPDSAHPRRWLFLRPVFEELVFLGCVGAAEDGVAVRKAAEPGDHVPVFARLLETHRVQRLELGRRGLDVRFHLVHAHFLKG